MSMFEDLLRWVGLSVTGGGVSSLRVRRVDMVYLGEESPAFKVVVMYGMLVLNGTRAGLARENELD